MAVVADGAANRSGLALVEFAFALPLLLILGLGGIETAHFMSASLRLSQIAMTVADNAGRVRTSIDEADINELMVGAKKIGEPISFSTSGRIILSDLEQRTNVTGGATTVTTDNPNGYRQWIRWQRCAGALNVTSSYGVPLNSSGTAVTNLDDSTNTDHGAVETKSLILGMGSSTNMIAASTGTAVMVAEVAYTYQPVTPIGLFKGWTIRRLQAFNVRQRTDYVVRNDGALSGTGRSDCKLFNSSVPT
ncbi:TadE/TadG family type IV pilus assembly protein [Sphingomonas sp. GC_Shp_4]|uniref:TadE/TadG family type IV pilus assembly protein n=1 Tax=Sphingomonas sp. GC_Shp_4 TaxID=2937382 RepID=UPI00226B0AB1|nr:TadE/TadG family type IV pilus assembly protein [Sphingomonas sp. GC_Shp_4]